MRAFLWVAASLALAVPGGAQSSPRAGDGEELFETRIRPVLMRTCFKCHGGDKTAHGLRVDSRQALLKGGERGPALVPGKPEEGLLLKALRYADEDLRMPPKEKLADKVVDDFARWVAMGAPWPETPAAVVKGVRHWAFQPRAQVDPAAVPGDAVHPIDRLIRAAQVPQGLRPVPLADKRVLIRRASIDLTGLPPSPERVEAFLADERPDAFERLVEELLASPRYGERWGRHWLDVARYADTAGDDSDYPVPQAALYRDWVIDAFNQDKPYDEFLLEQVAGDLLARAGPPEKHAGRTIATGFLAQAKRYGTHKHEDMHLIIEDTISTVGQAVLGLTLRCARCHDHKYDPTTSEDYYALYGFFQSIVYPHPGSEEMHQPNELIPLVPESQLRPAEERWQAEYGARLKGLEADLKKVEEESEAGKGLKETKALLEAIRKEPKSDDREARRKQATDRRIALEKEIAEKSKALRAEIERIRKLNPSLNAPVAYAVKEGKPVDAKLQVGGEPNRAGAVVRRGLPRFLFPQGTLEIEAGTSGRLELARWLASAENPLTARVMANRIWQHHFGKGLVATPSNFGIQGEPPSHPELLDYLAARFIESGWSVKAMHRLILGSETWRSSSANDPGNLSKDSGNRWYWRQDRRRLDAESLRDSLLLLSGTLKLDRPGLHPFPPPEKWNYSAHRQFNAVYPSEHRSVYLMVQRLHPHPYLSVFNGADAKLTTDLRDASTVAPQALFLANSPFVHELASKWAARLLAASSVPDERVRRAYLEAFGRPPSARETERALDYVRRYAAEVPDESRREGEAWASLARVLFASNEFYHVD
jgi:cytochrome c553